jgi:hypothetical protein
VIAREKVTPVTNVNFSISVGTAVPRSVRLRPLSSEIVTIVPQYRGYNYFVTSNQVVIVEPSTYKIVTVLPYSGSGSAAVTTSTQRTATSGSAPKFSAQQREVIRKQITSRPMQGASRDTRELRVGQEVPSSIVVEEFPEVVYRDIPEVRSYRYYRTERNVVVIDPDRHTVIDVIE